MSATTEVTKVVESTKASEPAKHIAKWITSSRIHLLITTPTPALSATTEHRASEHAHITHVRKSTSEEVVILEEVSEWISSTEELTEDVLSSVECKPT
jgi:hypothetical protein